MTEALRYTYARGLWSWSEPTSVRSLPDEIAYSLALAVVLHIAWVWVVSLFGFKVDLFSLFVLLAGSYGKDSEFLQPAITSLSNYPMEVSSYFLSLYVASAALGYLAHWLVRGLKLDRNTQFFRFNNQWYYLLSGEVYEFRELGAPKNVTGVFLTAAVDQGGASYLYGGLVTDWSFDRNRELDRIVLRLAYRRPLTEDEPRASDTKPEEAPSSDSRFYDIKGGFLCP